MPVNTRGMKADTSTDTSTDTPIDTTTEPLESSPPKLPLTCLDHSFKRVYFMKELYPNGKYVFIQASFRYVNGYHEAWWGDLDLPQDIYTVQQAINNFNIEQAMNCMHRIPDKEIYPAVYPAVDPTIDATGFTLAEDTFLKGPGVKHYEDTDRGNMKIACQFLEEIVVYHLLQQMPHPNIAEFKGCLQKDGRLVGILLKRYPSTLHSRVMVPNQPPVNSARYLKDIEAGLAHLHELGFAHNDINPYNVVVDVDEQDRAVIIDMGAVMRFGDTMITCGTAGFNDGFKSVSSVVNGQIGVQKIKEWLHNMEEMKANGTLDNRP